MNEDKIKKILIVLIGILIILILFVVIPTIVRGNKGSNINITTEEIFKKVSSDKNSEDTKKESNNKDTEDIKDKEIPEIEVPTQNENEETINRNLSDPFYPKIKEKLEKQKYFSDIYIPRDYYPGDNYVKNAAGNDGKVHVFKKQPILVYIPRNEYYDAITQAFVTYNNTFKGLLTFNTVKNPEKAQIKIVLTDDFGNKIDVENAIGIGRPLRFDNEGNILYSEVSILTKNKFNNEKTSLIMVYNTLLHELGHALGIMGHSQDPNDVMYKEISSEYHNELKSFSDRDIETFKILYSNKKILIENALKGAKEEKLEENLKYAQESNDADSYIKVATSYYEMGDYSKALDAYKKALALNPNNYRIYLGLSYCYERAKQYEYAITYAKYALERAVANEQKADCNYQIGIVYFDQKKYTDAYPYLKDALELDKTNPIHFVNYIVICANLGRKDLASEAYNKYINNYNMSDFSEEQMEVVNWAKK